MDFYQKLLWNFFDKRIIVKDNMFYTKMHNGHVYGSSIIDETTKIFGFEYDEVFKSFESWSYERGLIKNDITFKKAYNPIRLNFRFSIELMQDISAINNSEADAEKEIIRVLINELSEEIDTSILSDILNMDNFEISDFFKILKCLGFELGPTLYCENTFVPKRSFISTTYNDMINERQINTYWKNWIRANQ